MNMEQLQLMVDAGPNAVAMMSWYAMAGVGKMAVFFGSVLIAFKMFANGCRESIRWDALSKEQQNILALKSHKLLPKGFKPEMIEVIEKD